MSRTKWHRAYTKFQASADQIRQVGHDEKQQAAARLLIRKAGLCGYQSHDLICDIGKPRYPSGVGRIWKQRTPERPEAA